MNGTEQMRTTEYNILKENSQEQDKTCSIKKRDETKTNHAKTLLIQTNKIYLLGGAR